MKRLQVLLPDDVYDDLKTEAQRRQLTVADLVRRSIDRQLASAHKGPFRPPSITPLHLGIPLLPLEHWREAANDRLSE